MAQAKAENEQSVAKVTTVAIKCQGADLLPLDAIEEFQGALKKRSKKDIESIITSIGKFGFSFPFFVWNGTGHNLCLDGHGRIQALAEIRRRGYNLPLFPVCYIEAVDEAEAKQKLLRLNSQYGQMTVDSVMEFMDGLEIDSDEISLPESTMDLGSKNIDLTFDTNNSDETIESLLDHFDITLTFEIKYKEAMKRLEKKIKKQGMVELLLSHTLEKELIV